MKIPEEGNDNPPQYSYLCDWTEEPGGLQSLGMQRVEYNWTHTQMNEETSDQTEKQEEHSTQQLSTLFKNNKVTKVKETVR